ncbi:hypothetical protein DRP77_07755 [Candidatus Poribacteria bacterium]|nr:MAG: hypothetical protein DRP77_07755 [Candidatus Poribacteria bacterium]
MSVFQPAETLRRYRALFLACEAIGWLHMAGKAKADFLRRYGGAVVNYDYQRWYEQETPPFPWDDLLGWIKERFAEVEGVRINWPDVPARFITEHTKQNPGMLGLLQAGHAIASGVEKQSYPDPTIWYLSQDVTHMWLSSAFGRPTRNLLADPPEALTGDGWKRLVEEIRHILEELKSLGTGQVADVGSWRSWRDRAIGPQSFLRRAFLSTAAETRLPNNDVTLWDQSYVAAALFKSAVAGAVLEASKRKTFPWDSSRLKQLTRWRLLTVGIGTDHYEARAVKIGDWKGAEADVQRFFDRVCVLIEVDLAVGSLLYQDTSVAVFSFPGERYDEGDFDDRTFARWLEGWEEWLQEQVNGFARELQLETPPYLKLSRPTRSLVPMARQMRKARAVLAVPVHRPWKLSTVGNKGHVCPVCQVRLNDDPKRKSHPCKVCERRRTGRLDAWLSGKLGSDTIWMDEVADHNGRVALLTLSLDLDPWLEGDRVDSLRTQAISEWRRFNPVLKNQANPIDTKRPFESMLRYLLSILNQRTSEGDYQYNWNDPVLSSLSRGFPWEPRLHPSGTSGEVLWRSFFNKLVEDRARDEVSWDILKEDSLGKNTLGM